MNESWQAIMVITVSYNLSKTEIFHSMGSSESAPAPERLVFVAKLVQQFPRLFKKENLPPRNQSITALMKYLK